MDARCIDIWRDAVCLELLKKGILPNTIDLEESKRAKKRVSNYCWKEQRLYFKGLLVPKPKERMSLVIQMHEDLGHFGEQRTLAEIYRRYFWHDRTEDVKTVVRRCQQCQLVRSAGSIRSEDEQLKSIPIYDLFHRIALDTTGPLPETKSGNKYIQVAIDHYSKWCEAKAVADHGAKTASKFLEDDIICRYGVPKFVLTDNGGEWAAEFKVMCKDYGIQHQHTAPQWPQCNGMAERMIKTIKHGIIILVATPANVDYWDEHPAKILFGYCCGIQASTRFSPFMILTGRTPRLRADNYLHALTAETDDGVDVEVVAAQFLQKVELIASIRENVLLNVGQAQKQQRKPYATRKGKHLFKGLIAGATMVKMKKPGKRKALTTSWEGPYQFIEHADQKGNLDFEEGSRVCIIQDAYGHHWERSHRDLQIYHAPPD
jgi:transposase InsO family protein